MFRILKFYNIREKINTLSFREVITKDQKKHFVSILLKSKKIVSSWGGDFYFVYLPGDSRYNQLINKNYSWNRNYVIDEIKQLNIPIIDFHLDFLEQSKNPLQYFAKKNNVYLHYNVKGYEQLTDLMIKRLKNDYK